MENKRATLIAVVVMLAFAIVWGLSALLHERDIVRNLKDKGTYTLMFIDATLTVVDIQDNVCIVEFNDER